MHGPLLLEVSIHSEANILVEEGLVHEGQLHDCELFYSECKLTECFRCRHYGHIAKQCQGKLACGYSAKEHDTRSCPSSNSPLDYLCSNCKEKHTTWSRLCHVRQGTVRIAMAAYHACARTYKVPVKSPIPTSPPAPLVNSPYKTPLLPPPSPKPSCSLQTCPNHW
jgi:hypothetical protein